MIKPNMETEEFTFPISDPTHSPIDSPPLWQLSPTASPTPSYARKGYNFPSKVIEEGKLSPRKSCSYIQGSCLLKRSQMEGYEEDEQEEKMDMLWEDLNEDYYKKQREAKMIELHTYSSGSSDVVEFGCVPSSFRLVKTSHSIKGGASTVLKSTRKPSMVVLMKVLRKFFALQQSHISAKKRSR